jgi:hypothetical protein
MSVRSLCSAFESSFTGLGKPLTIFRPISTNQRIRPSHLQAEKAAILQRISQLAKKFPEATRDAKAVTFSVAFTDLCKSRLSFDIEIAIPQKWHPAIGTIAKGVFQSVPGIQKVEYIQGTKVGPLAAIQTRATIEINRREFASLSPQARDFFLASCIARANSSWVSCTAIPAIMLPCISFIPVEFVVATLVAAWKVERNMMLNSDKRAVVALRRTDGGIEYLTKLLQDKSTIQEKLKMRMDSIWPESRIRHLHDLKPIDPKKIRPNSPEL